METRVMRVSDYVIERLADEGVEKLFMVTGRGNLFLTDAVARQSRLKAICVHHEQSASYAAMAYSQVRDELGVCLVSTGCGSTNAITGLLCAWQDNVPCVFISGQNKLNETIRHSGIRVRTFGQQECDIISVVSSISKYSVMITDPQTIRFELEKAMSIARSGRPGPVWLDIPLDIQNMRVNSDLLAPWHEEVNRISPTAEDLRFVVDRLVEAKRPMVIAGGGVRSAGGVSAFRSLIESLQIPVALSPAAADLYGAAEPLSMGVMGTLGGCRRANFSVQNADFFLIVGCRMSATMVGEEPGKFAREASVVIVDVDPIEHTKRTVGASHFIHSDAAEFLGCLSSCNVQPQSCWEEWRATCRRWKDVFPLCEDQYRGTEKIDLHDFSDCLGAELGSEDVVVTDSGLAELIVPAVVPFRWGQRCIHPAAQGAMGYAVPAAVGASLATGRRVVVVVGDGSIMMNLQELQTIAAHRLDVVIFVVNNNVYSVIRTRQIELFRSRTIGTDPANGVSCPEFARVAECFGFAYARIDRGRGVQEQVREVLSRRGPLLCEVIAVEDQVYLHSSFTHNSQRKVVRRPIEDQSPFLPREIFEREMIVRPIDQ